MLTTTRLKIELAAGLVVIAGGFLGFRSWLGEHDAKIHADATVAEQKIAFDKLAGQDREVQLAEAARDAARDQAIAQIATSAKNAVSPTEIASWIGHAAAQTTPGVRIEIPKASESNPKPDAVITVPQAQLPALRDAVAHCEECAIKLTAAEADVQSRDQRLKIAGEELSTAERERDTYKNELKGGTFFIRVKKATKWIIVGGLAGVAAVCGSGHCK